MVDNIMEIEPVIKKEVEIPQEEKTEDEDSAMPPPGHDDPAQMKLEL
jgi:hypothetical protein